MCRQVMCEVTRLSTKSVLLTTYTHSTGQSSSILTQTYEDLVNTNPAFSTSPFEENQSLYWHPSIYRVVEDDAGETYYEIVSELTTGPYYRWDTGVLPQTVEFPPGFQMIAHSTDQGAGEGQSNLFSECCEYIRNDEGEVIDDECENRDGLWFPMQPCDELGIAFAMPTCWDGVHLGNETSGVGSDHKSHMAYTLNSRVNGPCPEGFPKRFPQIQFFLRVDNYPGGVHVLADGAEEVFHVDFFNGWQEGVLQDIIDGCPVVDGPYSQNSYNPPCSCDEFLTPATPYLSFTPGRSVAKLSPLCEDDIRNYILDEEIQRVAQLPRGTCQGASVIPRQWGRLEDPPVTCSPPREITNDVDCEGTACDEPIEDDIDSDSTMDNIANDILDQENIMKEESDEDEDVVDSGSDGDTGNIADDIMDQGDAVTDGESNTSEGQPVSILPGPGSDGDSPRIDEEPTEPPENTDAVSRINDQADGIPTNNVKKSLAITLLMALITFM